MESKRAYMKIRILCVGKIKDHYNQALLKNVCKEINKGNDTIEIIEYPDLKIPEHMGEKQTETFLEKEWEKSQKQISSGDYVIALCIEGKEITTSQHAGYVKKAMEESFVSVTYLIGGSLGLPKKLKERANLRLSFSKMTFPHQLMRVVLCEEIKNVLFREGF